MKQIDPIAAQFVALCEEALAARGLTETRLLREAGSYPHALRQARNGHGVTSTTICRVLSYLREGRDEPIRIDI